MNKDLLSPKNEKQLVAKWQDRIATAVKFRDRKAEEEGWERFIKEYKGHYDVVVGNNDVPPINEVFAFVSTSTAFMNSRDPYITLNAKKSGSVKGAKILEAWINHEWKVLKIKEETNLESIDCHLVGHGWNKDGINVETQGEDDDFLVTGERLYSNRVSWRDMVFNIGSIRAPHDCLWMAQRIIKPMSAIKKAYPAAAKMQGGPHPNLKEDEFKNTIFKDDIEFGTLWEIWDKEDRMIYLLGDSFDRLIKPRQKWPDYIANFPFNMMAFHHVPDDPYPMSDIKAWEPQILESIKLLAMGLNHVKRWNRQLLIQTGMVDEAELDKFEKGIDGQMIMVKGNPAEIAMPLVYAPLPPDIYNLMDRLDSIKRSINGQPELERGGETQTQTHTLGELKMISAGAQGRADQKVEAFESHHANIAKNLIAHAQAHFDMPRMVKITGDTPQEMIEAFGDSYDPMSKSVVFSKEDIIGEYDVDVKSGSTLPLDRQGRLAILSQVLQQATQLASAPNIPPFLQVVVQELLRDYDIKSLEQAFDQQTQQSSQMQQQQQQQQQIAQGKIEAETAKRQAQAKQIGVETMIQGGGAVQRFLQGHQVDADPGAIPQAVPPAPAGGPTRLVPR